jgi:hypothetical protein
MIEIVKICIDLKPGFRVPVTVPDYELPILAELHGEDRLVEDESKPRKKVADPFLEDAWAGIVGKYSTKDGEAARITVYRNEADFRRQTKFKHKPPDAVVEDESAAA